MHERPPVLDLKSALASQLKSAVSSRKAKSEEPTPEDIAHQEEVKQSKAILQGYKDQIVDIEPMLQHYHKLEDWEPYLRSQDDPKQFVLHIVEQLAKNGLIKYVSVPQANKLVKPFGKSVGNDFQKERFFRDPEVFGKIVEQYQKGSGMKRKMKGKGIIGGVRCSTTKCKEPSTDEIIGIIKAGNDNINLKKELLKRT